MIRAVILVMAVSVFFVEAHENGVKQGLIEPRGKGKYALLIHFFYVAATKIFVLKVVYGIIFYIIATKAWHFLLWFTHYLKEKKHHHVEHEVIYDHNPYSHDSYGHNPYGHNPSGHDSFGHNPSSYDSFGHNPSSHDSFGHNPSSHDSFGHNPSSHDSFGHNPYYDSYDTGPYYRESDQASFVPNKVSYAFEDSISSFSLKRPVYDADGSYSVKSRYK